MIGRTLGHYQILEKLGAGGMGEVYLAEDTTLKRKVALKILPAELAGSQERLLRFQREAESLAALNHTNIVHVYTVEEDQEIHFLTMELVDGQPLSELIPPNGLALDQFFSLAVPLADALSEAHEQGIVHRDLKPANIMVDGRGRPKILDFGLAKLEQIEPEAYSSQLSTQMMTQEGKVLGTYPYMSPEQAEGKAIDHRSDLFSFGSVLYEMATGIRPFQGDSPASLISSILRDPPPEVDRTREELPHHLSRIVSRCLEKHPDNRYQRAKNLCNDLERLRGEAQGDVPVAPWPAVTSPTQRKRRHVAGISVLLVLVATITILVTRPREGATPPAAIPEPRITSVAVLPLENLSGDPEQEYFAAGITEGLISDLGRIAALRVISRQSVMRYQNSDKSLPEIASELGVEALIEGSVLAGGDRVRITAQLVQADPEQHLWANTYDREAKDILTLLSEVTQTIVAEVQVAVSPEEQLRLAGATEVEPKAHEAYLKGKYLFDQFSPGRAFRAKEHYRQAIAVDPSYAPAWAGLAEVNLSLAFWLIPWDSGGRQQAAVEAEAAIERALELDDSLAKAHMLMGQVHAFRNWDWSRAEAEFRRAIELAPSDSGAHIWYAYFLSAMGRHDEALRAAERAERLDPLSPLILQRKGDVHRNDHDFETAIDYYKRALEWTPNNPWILSDISLTYGVAGMGEEAVAVGHAFRTLLAQIPDPPDRQRVHQRLAEGFDGATLTEAVHLWLAEAKDPASPIYMEGGPFLIAFSHSMLGEYEEALHWLEKSFSATDDRRKSVRYTQIFLGVHPVWDGLRSDQRFQDLVARMKFPD